MSERPRLTARKHSQRPHVLIVSDDPGLASFLNEGLPLGGFWTTVIASGLQALEVFRLRQFDLIVVDWELQSFYPLELIRRLRGESTRSPAQESRTTRPIVVISEHPTDLPDRDVQALGISRMFHAPIELDEITRDLHIVFDEWREAYPSAPMSDDPLDEKR